MKVQKVKRAYSQLASRYDAIAQKAKYTVYRTWGKETLKYLPKKAKILDLGCGTGLSSTVFFKKKHQVTGIDAASGMIKQARKLPFVQLICQDIQKKLKVKEESFDGVLIFSVMELVDAPQKVILNASNVLKKEGILSITIPLKSKITQKMPIHTYTRKEAENMFKKANLKILKTKKMFGYQNKQSEFDQPVNYLSYVLRK